MTLEQVFQSLRLAPTNAANSSAHDLSIDALDMHAHTDSFHRFDRFNCKYNPLGESRLREIFLKTDNSIKGRYLAEVVGEEVFGEMRASKYQHGEPRVSIYGKDRGEWDRLAAWIHSNNLERFSSDANPTIKWMVQIPRLFESYRQARIIGSFAEFLENLFGPLIEASAHPESSDPLLVDLLDNHLGAFDTVDDESKPESSAVQATALRIPPQEWGGSVAEAAGGEPPYSYYLYHLWANIARVNEIRRRRGLCVFALRPHCGEAGDPEHLLSGFLLAQGIQP